MARTKDTDPPSRGTSANRGAYVPPGAEPPKKKRFYTRFWDGCKQIWAVYKMARRHDPSVTWIMLGIFILVLGVAIALGIWWNHPVYATVVGLPIAALGPLLVLTRRAERAAYAQIEGQPGASRAAVGSIRRGWTFAEEPVAIDPRTKDLVIRGTGRAGVVLISEGPPTRAARLLEAERKRVARVLPNVPITLIQCGNEEGQVKLQKLPRTVQKLKPTLTKPETAEVEKRLRALGAARMPIPKGVDPMRARPDRKGMKGR